MSRKPIVRLTDSFKVFADKFNILTNNVGDPARLRTHNDSDLVTVLNEFDATFHAYEGKIVYPNDSVPKPSMSAHGEISYTGAQLPSTHLVITTNQHGGQDIDIDAGRDFLVDAVRNINLTGVSFDGDYSGNYNLDIEGTSTVDVASTANLTTGGDFVQNTTGHIDLNASSNIILDAGADVILDAGDSDLFFRRNGTVFVKTQMGMSGDATLTRQYYQQGGLELDAAGNITLDASGDIVLDAGDSDILFKRDGTTFLRHRMGVTNGVTYTKQEYPQGSVELEAANDIVLDAVGDIILDADGNDLVFRNGEGGDSAQINLSNSGNLTVTAPAALTLDIAGDINIDAGGDNIRLKDGGTTRQEYTLGATTTIATTGNRTETVTGNVSDSAAGTYHIGATGNFDLVTQGTHTVNTNSHLSQYVQGNVTLYNTGQFDIDAGGDIYLDAGDSDIHFQRNNDTFARWNMGIPGDANAFQLKVEKGDFHVDASGDISLDAGDSDIIFKRNGTTFAKWEMGINGFPTYTRQSYPHGSLGLQAASNVTIDAGLDIILEANGGDVYMKDGSTEYLRFAHAGEGNGRIDNNGIPVITFNDSDAVFNSDVNIEDNLDVDGTLNVDGATTLNGHVDLGNAAADDISINGKVDTNILPKTNNANNIGSSTNQWRHAWFDGTVFADNLDGDSGTIANFNFRTNTMSGTSNIILDTPNDIILDAGDSDVIFKRDGDTFARWKMGITGSPDTFALATTRGNFHVDATGDIILDAGDSDIQFWRNGVAYEKHRLGVDGDVNQTRIEYPQGSLFLDVSGDIIMEADGGDIYLKDDGTQFGRFQNTSGNLIIRSGDTTAMTFDGANVTMAGQITLPSADLDTTAKTVHGAINEVDSDLGERTSLSSFYDGHNQDVVTALNRVAARIIDVYDENGTLLNN
jgi:hypothetical protein